MLSAPEPSFGASSPAEQQHVAHSGIPTMLVLNSEHHSFERPAGSSPVGDNAHMRMQDMDQHVCEYAGGGVHLNEASQCQTEETSGAWAGHPLQKQLPLPAPLLVLGAAPVCETTQCCNPETVSYTHLTLPTILLV